MADEIQIQTKLYATKGGAYLPSQTTSKTLDMAGTDMGSATQSVATSDAALSIPASVTGDRWVEINSLEPEGGNYIELSTATGGSFAASIFGKITAAGTFFGMIPSAVTWYAKANTAAVLVDIRACEK